MSPTNVLICGGGIAGLTLALALERRAQTVEVLERRAAYGAEGAGILLAQNALQVFDLLGLGEALRDRGQRISELQICRQDGTLLQRMRAPDTITIHRDTLHTLLLESVQGAVHLDCAPDQIDVGASGVSVVTRLGTHRASVLVGADGIGSAVREACFGSVPRRSSGQTCWRAVVPGGRELAVEYWAPGQRVGLIPLPGERTYVYLVLDQRCDEVAPWSSIDELLRVFGDFPDEVRQVLIRLTNLTDLRRGHLEQIELPGWVRPGVVLIGDAAHAMTPNMGQGACQAIEDAAILAQVLGDHRPLSEYEAIRRPRVSAIQTQSWRVGQISHLHNALGRALRDTAMRCTPQWVGDVAVRDLASVPGLEVDGALSPILPTKRGALR